MPSSLVTRIRAFFRSAGGDLPNFDGLQAVHIGTQDVRDRDRSVLLLIILHDGDQGAADRNAGAVQRVHEACALLAGLAAARLHAPRLELAAIGAARYLAIGTLPRQPDLY